MCTRYGPNHDFIAHSINFQLYLFACNFRPHFSDLTQQTYLLETKFLSILFPRSVRKPFLQQLYPKQL